MHRLGRAALVLVLAVSAAGTGAAAVDLEVTSVSVPGTVRAGQTIDVNVTVANRGDSDAGPVEVQVRGWGQTKATTVRLDAGERRTAWLNISVPTGAEGSEDVEVRAEATEERDVTFVAVDVEPFRLTAMLDPETVPLGSSVTVSGVMSAANTEAGVYVDGFRVGTARSDRTGQYRLRFTPEETGSHRVQVRVGGATATRYMRVVPRITVARPDLPDRVNVNESVAACTTVNASADGPVTVRWRIDGRSVASYTVQPGQGVAACQDVVFAASGQRTVVVEAGTADYRARARSTVRVLPATASVTLAPGELTVPQGQGGVVKASIHNDNVRSRTFTLRVEGIGNLSGELERTVTVEGGAVKTVPMRLVPRFNGSASGYVTVSADGEAVAAAPLTVVVRPPRTIVRTVRARLAAARDWAVAHPLVTGGAVAVLLLVLYGLVLRRRHHVMEPRY